MSVIESPIIVKELTGSTNDDAKILAEEGATHMTAVSANMQHCARGQRGRNWQSVEGNVHWSVVLRPQANWPRISDIVFVSALAVREAITNCIMLPNKPDLRLKWPNDILLNDRKLGGVLIEANGIGNDPARDWIVVGVGINVVSHPDGLDTLYPPTDLHHAGYDECHRDNLIRALQQAFDRQINLWLSHGFDDLRDRYLDHAHNLKQTIRVGTTRDKSDYKQGRYEGIDDNGHLILTDEQGQTHRIVTGDVLNHISKSDELSVKRKPD